MTRTQQAARRSELIAQLGSIASELAALEALTFSDFTVAVDTGSQVSTVNGLTWSGDLIAILQAQGMSEAHLPSDNDQRRAVVQASEAPPALSVGYYGTGADGESYERLVSVPWSACN